LNSLVTPAYERRNSIALDSPEVNVAVLAFMFTLAHLTDVHLGPLPRAESWRDYLGKRALGKISWHRRRRFLHDPAIAMAMIADIRTQAPDHVAVTGDLINIALRQEFVAAALWLKAFGPSDWITLVPGNHDAYRPFPWAEGAGLWAKYMTGDIKLPAIDGSIAVEPAFPFVRQRRNVALIGLSSAVPQSLFRAGGRLGTEQLKQLGELLHDLRHRGFYRVVLIHHPPVPGLTARRRALDDDAILKDLLEAQGAELVLYGHNHRHGRQSFNSRFGPVHLMGAPSATSPDKGTYDAAAWYLYRIRRLEGAWSTHVTVRSWDTQAGSFVVEQAFEL
jgi:3',5'-cyclic AMP phosphodiesterase CpdA